MTTALRDDFLRGMSNAAATVNIISTDGPAGRAGVTVSAMSSVSADTPKPTLLTCVHHMSPAAQKIIDNGCFVVNVLRDDQTYISDTFAGRFKDQVTDKFDCCTWAAMETGAPRVVDPLVSFDCRVVSSERVGTHHVFFGEVQGVFLAPHGSPLIYAHRSYGNHNRIEAAGSVSAGRAPAPEKLALGCFHGLASDLLPEIAGAMITAQPTLEIALVEGDQRRLQEALRAGEVEVALLHDIGLPHDLDKVAVLDLEIQVLLPASHPLALRDSIRPSDLAGLPLILHMAPPGTEVLLTALRIEGVEPKVALRSASIETVRGFVRQGLGYAPVFIPAGSRRPLEAGLVSRPLDPVGPTAQVVLATRQGAMLSPAAQRLTAFCQAHFGQTPQKT